MGHDFPQLAPFLLYSRDLATPGCELPLYLNCHPLLKQQYFHSQFVKLRPGCQMILDVEQIISDVADEGELKIFCISTSVCTARIACKEVSRPTES